MTLQNNKSKKIISICLGEMPMEGLSVNSKMKKAIMPFSKDTDLRNWTIKSAWTHEFNSEGEDRVPK
jgi:hypothetical protein